MNDRELEQKLAEALAHAVPDDLDAILARCGEQNRSVIDMKALHDKQQDNQNIIDVEVTEVRPKKKPGRWLAAACAALVLLGAGAGGGVYYQQSYAVASVVSLDVNPSIELKVNRKERVISCAALNTEAAAVLFDMDGGADLKGAKLDVAVNAIVGALVREGYLDNISSAILISVEDNDQDRAARLQQELVASVDGILQVQAPNAAVLSQTFTTDAGAQYTVYGGGAGMSAGKAALVRRLIETNGVDAGEFDRLAALSVEELNDLLKTGETRIPIGKDAAALAVDAYAGTMTISSAYMDVDPELDDVPPHYDVELHTAWGDFDYKVDAFTGAILSGQADLLNQPSQTPAAPAPETPSAPESPTAPVTPTNPVTPSKPETPTAPVTPTAPSAPANADVGEEAAKQAALDNAGLSANDVTNWKVEREWDDGQLEYEIEFWCGNVEYDYTIHGHTCAVLKCGVDHHSNSTHHSGGHHGGTAASSGIGQAAAKKAALDHAGLSESQVSWIKAEADWDDGRLEYDVEFRSGSTEYEYKIDGSTGAVLEYEQDMDD